MAVAEEARTESSATGVEVEPGGAAVQTAESPPRPGRSRSACSPPCSSCSSPSARCWPPGCPIVVALFGVGCRPRRVHRCSRTCSMVPDWAPSLVTMIGIGVGIDYALFIVTRYRTALADGAGARGRGRHGRHHGGPCRAVRRRHRGHLAAGSVRHGARVPLRHRGRHGRRCAHRAGGVDDAAARPARLLSARTSTACACPSSAGDRGEQGLWARWSRVVQRAPAGDGDRRAGACCSAWRRLSASLRFGYPDAGTGPTELTSRRAYDLVADAFGTGRQRPLVVAVELDGDPGCGRRAGPRRWPPTPAWRRCCHRRSTPPVTPPSIVVHPRQRAPGPGDRRPRPPPARRRRAGRGRQTASARVHVGGAIAAFVDESAVHERAPPGVHRRGHRPVVPPAAGRVPLAAGGGEGGGDERAGHRRRLRRDGPRPPGRMVRRAARHHRADADPGVGCR